MTVDLDAIEALANAATPGPWTVENRFGNLTVMTAAKDLPLYLLSHGGEVAGHYGVRVHDAPFIAAARTAVPALVAEVRALRAEDAKMADLLAEQHRSAVRYMVERDAERAAHAETKAEVERLREALVFAARWLGSTSPAECFDEIAEWFWQETHIMRPGKSVPLEMGNAHTDEDRRAAFKVWADAKGEAVRATIRAALAGKDKP